MILICSYLPGIMGSWIDSTLPYGVEKREKNVE